MESLPPEIVANIVSRTPIVLRTIIHCRNVCKKWRSVFSEPCFAHLQLSSSTWLVNHERLRFKFLELGELDDETGQVNIQQDPVTTIKYHCCMFLRGIVNGLIICLHKNYYEEMYICNPVTREYIPLAKHINKLDYTVFYGLGFIAAKNQYKVVRFDQRRNNPYQSDCVVYTLGTGMWRDIRHLPFEIGYDQESVLFNGNLHWLAHDQQHITSDIVCTFDLDKEFSTLTASAPIVNETEKKPYRSLGVLGGCLCICDNTSASEVVIWVLKDYGKKECWSKEIVIEKDSSNTKQLYCKRVHVMAEPKDGFILIGVNYNTGTHTCTKGFSYHRRSKKLQQLGITSTCKYGEYVMDECVMVYVPNFISLKSIVSESERERVLTF